ncbi:hypothetical protein SDC9_145840 [bioreactor metagenome]|uniref:Uncharacterized protein n=1 Tax=bioreactor metagenome TaxID=1076179 RepID=A0A645EDB3_9ZZZZ
MVRLEPFVAGEHPRDRLRLQPRHLPPGATGHRRVAVRVGVGDLGPADLAEQIADHALVGLESQPAGRLDHQAVAVVGQPWQGTPVRPGPEVLGLAQRRGVERPGLHPAGPQLLEPAPHLPRRAGGERHRQDLGGGVRADRAAVGDPVGDGTRLAGPRPRDHRNRTGQAGRHVALLGIQAIEQGFGRRQVRGWCGHAPHCRSRRRQQAPAQVPDRPDERCQRPPLGWWPS